MDEYESAENLKKESLTATDKIYCAEVKARVAKKLLSVEASK